MLVCFQAFNKCYMYNMYTSMFMHDLNIMGPPQSAVRFLWKYMYVTSWKLIHANYIWKLFIQIILLSNFDKEYWLSDPSSHTVEVFVNINYEQKFNSIPNCNKTIILMPPFPPKLHFCAIFKSKNAIPFKNHVCAFQLLSGHVVWRSLWNSNTIINMHFNLAGSFLYYYFSRCTIK